MPQEPTDRTRVRRQPHRGQYEPAVIHAILDEALICHVGFVHDGAPFVIPTIHTRIVDRLYLHGAVSNRMLGAITAESGVCVTATLLDGLVLARSAFHHSMNYRSVMILGRAHEVTDETEKRAVLAALVEHVARGRSADARPANDKELATTRVVCLPITEASAKVREGPPVDDEPDYALPGWAGILPLRVVAGEPVPGPRLAPGTELPTYLRDWSRPRGS